MCGIAGIVSQCSVTDRTWLITGRDTMIHRGPDDAGEWWSSDHCVGLAQRRLAIIDLSPGGHQPMMDASEQFCITFNGEIYNYQDLRRELESHGYRFRTTSDTEVILEAYRAWGVDCISRLNGMFAFALYDIAQRRLLLARDRAGEKPLFYIQTDGRLVFASELKALMADPALLRRIDLEALDCFLAMGYVPGNRCILRGVMKLPPAHALVFNLGNGHSRLWRYWQLPEPDVFAATGQANESALLDELDALLEDAVRRQLVADVPVGVLLSGGVDSSLVTAMAVRKSAKVKTFTVRFPGHGRYDETEHARLVARYFGTDHVEMEATNTTADLLPTLARQFDEPMVDSSIIPTYLVSQLIRQHCTVALGGDGGDELFGGYGYYSRLLQQQQHIGKAPRSLRKAAAFAARHVLPVGFKGRNWLQMVDFDTNHGLPYHTHLFDLSARKQLMAQYAQWSPVAEKIRMQRTPLSDDILQRATRMDFENFLVDDILVKVDRASMLNSLEVRAPWLDYRIVEFAFGKVPSYLKATTTGQKLLLKRLCGRVLPEEFDQQRKQGFSIPLGSWLESKPWQQYFNQVLMDSGSSTFDPRFVAQLLAGQRKGRSNSERLFGLVMFELWRREYRISI
jgi:asparagine synthase (glutamine-hydrolysing)